jgi:mono/diheme cytochrome c family protein
MTSCSSGWRALVILVASWSGVAAGAVRAAAQDVGTEAQRESGRQLYVQYCAQCHGENGDGEGYATPRLNPRPRDFTTGKFKVRTTPTGALPTHQDLINVIRRGMPYTSMPAWPTLSDRQLSDLAYFIKTFSPDFSNPAYVAEPVPLPSPPSATSESIELGKTLYVETGCVRCHGALGRGDGSSAPTLRDDWGDPIRAADLTQSWTFRGGSSREDIFRTMTTGFSGTPMPGFADALTPEQRWAMTDFIVSLSGSDGPGYTNVVVASHVQEPIDLARGVENFASAPVARFPIVGQIMQPGRAFQPAATSVTVQAIHDADAIAFLVRWHDMSAQDTGINEPSLAVPLEEEEQAPAGAPQPEADPFGQAAADPFAEAADPFAEAEAAPAVPASEFSDAVAVQMPSEVPTGARRPYFIFGDAQNPVDLWFFDLARPEPQRFTGRGSADIAPNDTGELTGVASYDQGEWSVIFQRPLRPASGASLSAGAFMPLAFSVWDGFSRERGTKRGLTLWYSLYVEPEEVPSAAGPMVRTALVILAIELAVIGWARRRHGSPARGDRQPAATSG